MSVATGAVLAAMVKAEMCRRSATCADDLSLLLTRTLAFDHDRNSAFHFILGLARARDLARDADLVLVLVRDQRFVNAFTDACDRVRKLDFSPEVRSAVFDPGFTRALNAARKRAHKLERRFHAATQDGSLGDASSIPGRV